MDEPLASARSVPVPFQRPIFPTVGAIEAYFGQSRTLAWFANGGPCHTQLIERASSLLGGRPVVPVSSAGLGLVLALRALVGEPAPVRRQVILPSFTFAATAAAIVWAGFDPVFCDIDPDSWQLCPLELNQVLRSRPDRIAAVLACSTFGTPAPAEHSYSWAAAAAQAGVPLLIDSAAGLGADLTPGLVPDAEVFSMHATKPLPVGEGGLVVLGDAAHADQLALLANHGLDQSHNAVAVGLNAKLDEWHCAAALAGLDLLGETVRRRRSMAAAVRDAVRDLDIRFQGQCEASTFQFIPALMPSTEHRDRLLRVGKAYGVEMRTYFDPPLHQMPAYVNCDRFGALSVTERIARRIVSLPMATDLRDVELNRVAECLRLCA